MAPPVPEIPSRSIIFETTSLTTNSLLNRATVFIKSVDFVNQQNFESLVLIQNLHVNRSASVYMESIDSVANEHSRSILTGLQPKQFCLSSVEEALDETFADDFYLRKKFAAKHRVNKRNFDKIDRRHQLSNKSWKKRQDKLHNGAKYKEKKFFDTLTWWQWIPVEKICHHFNVPESPPGTIVPYPDRKSVV